MSDFSNSLSLDFERLSQETEIVGYPVLPLVRQLVEQVPEDVGKYIHWGATTQDIVSLYPCFCATRGHPRPAAWIQSMEV